MSTSRVLVGMLAALGVAAALAPAQEGKTAAGPKVEADIQALIDAHNRERARAELPPLASDPKLTEAAAAHAKDMAAHAKMSHEGSDGSTPAERIKRAGFRGIRTGENVAYGQRSIDGVMKSWMDSPGHRANILGEYTQIGVARARDADGVPYWCVDFGTPWPELEPAKAAGSLVAAINKARAAHEKPELVEDEALAEVAARHAKDCAEAGEIRAKDSDGLTPFERIGQKKLNLRELSLGAAANVPDAEALVKAWMDDEGQRKSLLGTFSRIGTGYATDKDGKPYWVVIFGARPGDRTPAPRPPAR